MATSSWPTLEAFTLDLTSRLREGGSTSLAQFEASVNRDCYEWLDDYLENIEAQGRRAPIAELMKTPSRTATAKKTRATATANKTRAEQIRQFNLALSPLTKTPAGRMPLSPLRMQDANSVPQSPTRSPLKGKTLVLTPMKEEAPKPAPKKRGRPKKNANVDKENAEPAEAPSKSTRNAATKATPTSTASKPTKTRKGKAKKEAKVVEPEPEPVVEPESEPVVDPEPEPVVEAEPEPMPVVEEEPPTLAAAMAAEEEQPAEPIVVDDSFETIALEPATEAVAEALADAMEVDEPAVAEHTAPASPVKEATPAKSPSPEIAKSPSPVKEASPAKESSPVKEASPPPPSVPTRQVRSSWLSQALGTNTIPIGHRMSTQFDPLRKSQMATSQSKRKSDADEDDTAPLDKRPDKVARFDAAAATDAASGLPVSPKQFGSSRQPASAKSLPQAQVSTPASAATRLAATSVPQAQGRMSKLQEMKERTAAAAAARQLEKAAAAATTEQATAANGGFLRNLGGFLNRSAGVAENGRDQEAQELAERELTRVLQELAEQDKKAEEERLVKEKEAAKALEMEDAFETEDFGDRVIVIDDESADEYEVNDSVTLPSLPGDNSYMDDDDDDEPMQETALSALAAAGIQIPSTTPARTPPRPQPSRIARAVNSPTPAARTRGKTPTIVVSPPPKPKAAKAVRTTSRAPSRATSPAKMRGVTPTRDVDDEADDEDDELYTKMRKGTSSRNGLNSSVSSTMSTLTQAERMAGKVLGVKATPNRVRSVQVAEVAAKKEREEKERRAKQREQLERKKAEDKKRREEEERVKEEEERAKRRADEEERRRKLAHNDKIRRLKLEKAEQLKKQREAEEQKAAEEEAAAAAAKRKAAAASTLSRSQSSSNLTKATASSLNKAAGIKTPSAMKRLAPTPSKVTQPLNPSKTTNAKTGPNAFRVEAEASTSTIKAVNRPTLGPPSRTSHLGQSAAGPSRPSAVRTHAATALQQQRATLQVQLDQKALDEESENIVLPDINSEYSDSDDSDRETDFKRPAWAESPELKQALEMQASVNPDELFGPIRPLSMEELFNARVGKFRARTSSANWSGADRLTEAEEREYARRMGFKPINAPRDGGA